MKEEEFFVISGDEGVVLQEVAQKIYEVLEDLDIDAAGASAVMVHQGASIFVSKGMSLDVWMRYCLDVYQFISKEAKRGKTS